jgi:two-component system chemotaxis response regulator CheY
VLIVDDSRFMRMLLGDLLAKNDFEIVGEAESAQQALEEYRSLRPDLVTMDILMPGKDGIEATRDLLREDPQARVVMVTAMGMEDYIQKAVEAGASGFILKPFSPERVVDTLRRVLDGEKPPPPF